MPTPPGPYPSKVTSSYCSPSSWPVPRKMARSMLSFGMFSFFAARIAVRKRGFELGSPPPMRAAMEISRMILVNTRPRFASVAAFLCLIVDHFECPDMTNPRFSLGPGASLGHRFHCNFAPQRRRTKPPIHGRAKGTTPVRNLSVNRKPLRNCPSLAYPPRTGNLYALLDDSLNSGDPVPTFTACALSESLA